MTFIVLALLVLFGFCLFVLLIILSELIPSTDTPRFNQPTGLVAWKERHYPTDAKDVPAEMPIPVCRGQQEKKQRNKQYSIKAGNINNPKKLKKP